MNMSPPYQITILRSAYLDMHNYLSTKYSNQNAYQMKLRNLIGSAQESPEFKCHIVYICLFLVVFFFLLMKTTYLQDLD